MTATRPLKILVLEDSPADFLLLRRHLERNGVEAHCRCVATTAELGHTFTEDWDLALSDFSMPGMDFVATLNTLRACWPEIPVILVSGSVGEERAVDLLRQGVTDFVLKDNLSRLVPAIRRAIDEAAERQARRAVEAELHRKEGIAQAEQQRHTEALQAAVDRLTEMNVELERLAVIAAHDLREPLRGIISFAQLLEKHCIAKLDDTEREYIRYVVDNANRMNDLIGGLLAYSRVTATTADLHPVSAAAACTVALDNLGSTIADSNATISVDPLPQVRAQDVQLVQVFQNLIGNALKFRHPQRPPLIQVTVRRLNGDWLFTVADNGIGFDPSEQDVFELFRQLAPHQHRRGVGTGLAVCKRILQKLCGRIWVEAVPGQGASFHFTLPVV
ncbi:MAG: response regulator [Magnetospirillum gryphiswaldense]|nr:response regulator [Magnetospirillum gryphiswaldense]